MVVTDAKSDEFLRQALIRHDRSYFRVHIALSEIYTDEGVWRYLKAKNKHLDDRTPIELIALGRGKRVLHVVKRLF